MASQIKVGEGFIRPGDAVPMYNICAVEVEPRAIEKHVYKGIWKKWAKYLNPPRPAAPAASAGPPTPSTKGLRDMAVHRLLFLSCTDMRFDNLNTVPLSQGPDRPATDRGD
ncbi:hypothetical protein LTS17_008488 [Exophiala oligosperma]